MTSPRVFEASYERVLAVVSLSTFVAMLAYAGPLGNAVTLTRALDATPAGTTWILASMSVGLAVALITAGVVADRVGRRSVFVMGAAVFAASSIACALAGSTAVFVIARIAAGIGAAGMIATGLGLVASVSAHDAHRSRTATWWSVAMGAGIAIGPVLTGGLDLVDGWRAFYWLLAAGGVILGVSAARLGMGGRPAKTPRPLDLVGFVLLTGTLLALVAAVVEIRSGGSGLARTLFVAAAVLLVALIVSQRYGRAVLVDPALFRRGKFFGATAAASGTGLGVISAMSFCCTFLVLGLGLSTLQAGALLAVWSGTSAVAALGFARLAATISGTAQLLGGLMGVAFGLALLSGLSTESGALRLVPGLLIAGVASGLLNTGLAREAVASVPASDAAMGSGANNTARYIGSSIGVTVAGVIAAGGGDLVVGWNRVALTAAAASLACAALVALPAATSRRMQSKAAAPKRG